MLSGGSANPATESQDNLNEDFLGISDCSNILEVLTASSIEVKQNARMKNSSVGSNMCAFPGPWTVA